jgi:hypothetical protein
MCGLLANVSHTLPQDLSGRAGTTISGASLSGFGRRPALTGYRWRTGAFGPITAIAGDPQVEDASMATLVREFAVEWKLTSPSIPKPFRNLLIVECVWIQARVFRSDLSRVISDSFLSIPSQKQPRRVMRKRSTLHAPLGHPLRR